jgi:CheY-like chemotaxis protein
MLMGGTIAVCSEEGLFTEVHVSLWLKPEKGAAERPAPQPQVRISCRGRVLVVEDEAVNRLAAVNSLLRLGYEAGQAKNGREALDILAREPFDAVLMDIQMPVMSGIEAVRHIRASEAGSSPATIPIIALTAHAMAGDQEKFLAVGMDDYIAKPMDFDELGRVLARVMTKDFRSGAAS